MMFDTGVDIAKGVIDGKAKFEMNIYYKNIFGKGFHEYISYKIFCNDNEQIWKKFLDKGLDEYKSKIDKHDALKPIDEDDVEVIFKEIKDGLNEIFKENL